MENSWKNKFNLVNILFFKSIVMSESAKGGEKSKKYLEKIEDFFKRNTYIRYVVILFLSLSLLFFIEKNIFSILSLPWVISYLITSSWNWQFDQNIFREIFNVDNGIDKIRLLNLLVLWIFYWFFLTLINFVFNIFAKEEILHKKKKVLIIFLSNIFFIFSIFNIHAGEIASIAMFLISLLFFCLINFYFLKNNLDLASAFFYDDVKENTKNKQTKSHILSVLLIIVLIGVITYLFIKNNHLSEYYRNIVLLITTYKYYIISFLAGVYFIILFISFGKTYKDNNKKNIFSRNWAYGILILVIVSSIFFAMLSRYFDFDKKVLFLCLLPFLLLIIYKTIIYYIYKNTRKDFLNLIHLENKKACEIVESFGNFVFSSLFRNKILFILYFIWVIIFISTREINNQSIFQWVLPVKWYILINKYDENLYKIHNKLQLPEEYDKNNSSLINKIKFIPNSSYNWRILTDFCILWESDKNYYISTYYENSLNNRYDNSFQCKSITDIQPLKIEKNSDLEIRYSKNTNFSDFDNSIYKSLITFDYAWSKELRKDIYDFITYGYEKNDITKITTKNDFYGYKYIFDDDIHLFDKLFEFYLNDILNNADIIDYKTLISETEKRKNIINNFLKWVWDDNVYSYFTTSDVIDTKIRNFIGEIDRNSQEQLKNTIQDILKHNQTITWTKPKDKINAIEDNNIFSNISSDIKYINVLWDISNNMILPRYSNSFTYSDDKTKHNTLENWCIEVLTKKNIIYRLSNLVIKYTFTKKENGDYAYIYDLSSNKKLELSYWSCRE